ncbi:MAG TPA: HEPN domain-containing protein [bacterium]|nr:HEPN domain-containing protein [bacterium]
MLAIETFESAIVRTRRMLDLYDILCDTRQRDVRDDWAKSFKECMHWPNAEKIVRIDGKDKKSLLILRQELAISREQFAHEYVSELLRSCIVSAVSALDRYLHDLVVERCWPLLNQPVENIPKELRNVRIPILQGMSATERLRKDPKARPGHVFKKAVQDILHEETFQSSREVEKAAGMLGIKDFWGQVASCMPSYNQKKLAKKPIIDELNRIVARRNKIVHEADIERQLKGRDVKLRDIKPAEAKIIVDWLDTFVHAIDKAK